jgi:hypothetical protein
MKKLKYVKLFENFSDFEIKEGAYRVSGKELESMGIDAYRFVGKISVEDDVINFMISPRNELIIAIYVKCQDAQDLVNNFKKYPNKEISGMPMKARRECAGSIIVDYSGSISLRANNKEEFRYPEKYAGLIVDILRKWSEQTGNQDMGIRIGTHFHNLSEISILEAEKLMETELKKTTIQ